MNATRTKLRLVDQVGSRCNASNRGTRPHLRVLLSSAGRRVGLLRAFRSSAAALGADLDVFACDVAPEWSSACLEADFAFAAPPATSDEFAAAVLDLCRQQGISLVIPTIDTELIAFSEAREWFAASGITIMVASPGVVAMARDKLETARFLAAAGLPTPRTASAADPGLENEGGGDAGWRWPLLAKPRHGSSSRGIQLVQAASEARALEAVEPYIVQERLQGPEFTVNLFFDRFHKLKCAVPHRRLRIRGGEVEKGATVREPALCELASALAACLDRPIGPMCFQAMIGENGQPYLFEINARFGGGYPLAHHAGATFARWIMEESLDLSCTANDDWREDVVMLRYDDAIFL
jgi:carbamoyl-phosphate synthase large subunit